MDPPNYRSNGKACATSCAFCIHYRRGMNGLATCAKYRCLVLLTSICDSFSQRVNSDPPELNFEEESSLIGPWMKYPENPAS